MTRRDVFRAPLLAWRERRNRRVRHSDTRLYHGPIHLPDEVQVRLAAAPAYRTTHRHPALRLKYHGITIVSRTAPAASGEYVGEIVRTQSGALRVHLFAAANRPLRSSASMDEILLRIGGAR